MLAIIYISKFGFALGLLSLSLPPFFALCVAYRCRLPFWAITTEALLGLIAAYGVYSDYQGWYGFMAFSRSLGYHDAPRPWLEIVDWARVALEQGILFGLSAVITLAVCGVVVLVRKPSPMVMATATMEGNK